MKKLIALFSIALNTFALHAQADLFIRSPQPINEYYRVPVFMPTALEFSGKVENTGSVPANNVLVTAEVFNSSATLVYNAVSTATATLNPGDSMTFTVPSFSPPLFPEKYTVRYTATMSVADPTMSDNVISIADTFYVTDSVWARDNGDMFAPIATSGNAGGYLGQQFVLTQPATLTSITGYHLNNIPCNTAYVVFPYNNGNPGALAIASTDTISLGVQPGWVTSPISTGPLYLPADTFVIAARQFGSNQIDLCLSYGNYTPQSTWVKWQFITWTNIEAYGNEYAYPFMLRANIAEPTSTEEPGVNAISIVASPNPTQGIVTLNYDFVIARDAVIEVCNPLGQTIITNNLFGVQTGTATIDLQNQAAGIYLIAVTAGDQKKVLEVIVE